MQERKEYIINMRDDPEKEVFEDHEKHALTLVIQQKDKILERTPPTLRERLAGILKDENTLRKELKEIHGDDYNTVVMYLGVLGKLLSDETVANSKYGKTFAGAISLTLQGLARKYLANPLKVIIDPKQDVIAWVRGNGKNIQITHPAIKQKRITMPVHPGYGLVISEAGISMVRFNPYFDTSNKETITHLINGPRTIRLVVPHIGPNGKPTGKFALIIPNIRSTHRVELKTRHKTGKLRERHAKLIYDAYGIPIETEADLHEFLRRKYPEELAPHVAEAVMKVLRFVENAPTDARPELILKRLFDGYIRVEENKRGIRAPRVTPVGGKPMAIDAYIGAMARRELPRASPHSVVVPIGNGKVLIARAHIPGTSGQNTHYPG